MRRTVFLSLLLIFTLSFVLAVPPQTTTSSIVTTTGLQISYSPYSYVAQNSGFELNIHVFNATQNYVSNASATCLLHIYDPTGEHAYKEWANFSSNGIDFEWNIPGETFSNIGEHAFIIQCNTTEIDVPEGNIGFAFGAFEVTPDGVEPITDGQALIIFMSFLLIMSFCGLIFFAAVKTNNWAVSFSLYVVAALILLAALMYTMVAMDHLVFKYVDIVAGFTTFYRAILIFVYLGVISLFIFIGLVMFRLFQKKRGFID